MKKTLNVAAVILAIASSSIVCQAGVAVDLTPGTGAPPGTLGGYSMIGFPSESRAEFDTVGDVMAPAAFSGPLLFNQGLELDFVGSGWDTWSHGYAGAVYQLFEEAVSGSTSVELTLPPSALAFYCYIQPNYKDTFRFHITTATTDTLVDIDGNGGARYVGFYTDNPLDPLLSIVVDQPDAMALGFAVGEFGINGVAGAPEAGCWWNWLVAIAGLGWFGRHIRR
jgi:hypothetical protein